MNIGKNPAKRDPATRDKILEKIVIHSLTAMIVAIFLGGVVYCADQLKPGIQIREILFWGGLMLLFLSQIQRGMGEIFAKEVIHDE